MATYVSIVNELLRRLNEVPLDIAGDGFDSVRNVQALAKDAVNNSVRAIVQDGQEWPFLKTVYTQELTAGTKEYSFPADMGTVDWDTFYIKKLSSVENQPKRLRTLSYEEYIERHRPLDDEGATGPTDFVYQTYGTKFGVTPTPNAAYEIEYVYWSYPSDMTVYNDTCIIPDRFKHVVIDGAMMYMMRFRSNDQSAMIHQQAFQEGIKAMRRVLLDDKLDVRSTVVGKAVGDGR